MIKFRTIILIKVNAELPNDECRMNDQLFNA